MSIEEFEKILKKELNELAVALNTRLDNISDKLEFEFEAYKHRWRASRNDKIYRMSKMGNMTQKEIFLLGVIWLFLGFLCLWRFVSPQTDPKGLSD